PLRHARRTPFRPRGARSRGAGAALRAGPCRKPRTLVALHEELVTHRRRGPKSRARAHRVSSMTRRDNYLDAHRVAVLLPRSWRRTAWPTVLSDWAGRQYRMLGHDIVPLVARMGPHLTKHLPEYSGRHVISRALV